MDKEEISWIEKNINNPPKDIKIKKYSNKMILKIYTRKLAIHLLFFAIILCWGTIFSFVAWNGEQIFTNKLNVENILMTFSWLLFLFTTIFLIHQTIYSFFGYIKIVFGIKNYLFKGFFIFGVKIKMNWGEIIDFFQYFNVSDGEAGKISTPYIIIKINENKNIKISLEYLDDNKKHFLFSLIKYFKYKGNYIF